MENKQVIIDGCDVSGCERHCSDNYNNPNMCYSDMTETYSNCNPKETQCNFYITSIEKQLKRLEAQCEGMFVTHTDLEMKYKAKEQECEELKQRLQQCWKVEYSFVEQLDKLEEQLKAKEQECEKLKEEIEELKTELKDLYYEMEMNE